MGLVMALAMAVTVLSGMAPAGGVDDVTPPTLVDLTITPETVDTSGSDAVITFTAHVTDDLSAFQLGQVAFDGPAGQFLLSDFFDPGDLIAGDDLDGTYEFTATLPQYAAQGTWVINHVELRDNVNNIAFLSAADVAALGLPTTFEQTGAGDTTDPALIDFTISPTSVDTSAGEQVLSFTLEATDDLSGLQLGQVVFGGPAGQHLFSEFFTPENHLISGDELNGVYAFTATLPQYAAQGTWTLDRIELRDDANNNVQLDAAEVAALGLPTTFEQTGAGDINAPAIVEFSITPDSVNTASSDQVITFTARVTEDLSGFWLGSAHFESPAAGQFMFTDAFFFPTQLISGDEFDGTYEFTGTIPQFSEQGIWTIQQLQLRDNAQNIVQLDAADLGALGLPTQFEVKEEVSEDVPAGGTVTTDPEGDGATALDPVETAVTTPNAGTITIEETVITQPAPADVEFFGQQVNITAPPASADDPLVIVFTVDASHVPAGETAATVNVFKDGSLAADCTGAPMAIPDPCVTDRTDLPDGDVSFTLLTSSASAWNFGIGTPAENQPPVIDEIAQLDVVEGDEAGVAVTATDPDGDAMTLEANGLPAFASFVDNGDGTGELTAMPGAGDAGVYMASITASDGDLSSEAPVTINVIAAPDDGVHVASLGLNQRRRRIAASATVVDGSGAPVAGAVVTGTFSVDGADVATVDSRPTRSNGSTRLGARLGALNAGAVVEFCVDDVAHATLPYDPGANAVTCVEIVIGS